MTEVEPRAGTTERTIYLTPHRVIDAPVEAVYAAWTEPELLRRWLAPGNATVVRAVAEVADGGTFLVEMRGVDRRKWLTIMCPCGCGAMTRIGEDRSERPLHRRQVSRGAAGGAAGAIPRSSQGDWRETIDLAQVRQRSAESGASSQPRRCHGGGA